MNMAAASSPYRDNFEHLEDELRRLDMLLRRWLQSRSLLSPSEAEAQASRAVCISPAEVEGLLFNSAELSGDDAAVAASRAELDQLRAEIDSRLARSQEAGLLPALPQLSSLFRLSDFERDAIVICLAPELRRKYDRLYAYLQDDITRKRPSVELVLELLCDTDAQRWSARRFLADGGNLLRAGLVQKVEDPHSPSGSSGLAQFLQLEPRIFEFLLGGNQMDVRLAGQAQMLHPVDVADRIAIDPATVTGLLKLVEHQLTTENGDGRKLVLHFHGPQGVGKKELGLHICRWLGCFMLSIDAELMLAQGPQAESLLRVAFREALLQRAAIYVEHADALLQASGHLLLKALQVAIAEYGWLVFLSGAGAWTQQQMFPDCLFHSTGLSIPDVPIRTSVWERLLEGETPEPRAWAARLAEQFRMTPGQIRAAVDQVRIHRRMDSRHSLITVADLALACRQQSNHKLSELALKIEPNYGWDDLILPEDKLAHLREISSHLRHHYRVFRTWGFGKRMSRGKGVSALFTGPSGTGKTMAAEALGRELELDLYKVDLSGVVSKYIGETEKNLNRIFEEANTSNAILFFDEADALFGKRTKVTDAHDRYSNIETSYLLQKMEEHEGVVILATNLSENMDEAFTRRIRFIVEFPFPDEVNRLRIWKAHLPAEVPVAADVDYERLAREFSLSGGNIRNIALCAAFLAASDGGEIGLRHILHGTRREFEKLGRQWRESPITTRNGGS